jgi:hypothetical protein
MNIPFVNSVNNEQGVGAVNILIVLLFSLTFSSFVIAFILTQAYGANLQGNNMGIVLPGSDVIKAVQDYTTNDINDNVNFVSKSGDWHFVPNVGRVLDYTGLPADYYLMLKGVIPVGSVYTTIYQVNNSPQTDYKIVVRFTDDMNQIEVRVTNDGFHIPNQLGFGLGDLYFFPYPNANQEQRVKIKTVFDNSKNTLDFYFNDVLLFTKSDLPGDWLNIGGISPRYYAGVSSTSKGFTVESMNPTSGISTPDAAGVLQQVSGLFDVFTKIVLWNVDEKYLPLILNIIFIKTQLAGVIICAVAVFIRGVG